MTRLEKAEHLTGAGSEVLDRASNLSLAATALGVVYEITRKNPNKAAAVGVMGLAVSAKLKLAGVLYEKASHELGRRSDIQEDRDF